jgi:hypothetical protein
VMRDSTVVVMVMAAVLFVSRCGSGSGGSDGSGGGDGVACW